MSGPFSAGAARLAGQAGAVLGWRPADFWDATPAELIAVVHALAPEADAALAPADLTRLKEMFPDG